MTQLDQTFKCRARFVDGMSFHLPRDRYERRTALAGLLENANAFSVHRPAPDINESLAIFQRNSDVALRYQAEMNRSRALRSLEHRDYPEFARHLGLFEHYHVPMLLGLVHETIAKTLTPNLALPFLDPGTKEGSPYRYWKRGPLHEYSVAATLSVANLSRHSVLDFVTQLWEGSPRVSVLLDPQVPQRVPEAVYGSRPVVAGHEPDHQTKRAAPLR